MPILVQYTCNLNTHETRMEVTHKFINKNKKTTFQMLLSYESLQTI